MLLTWSSVHVVESTQVMDQKDLESNPVWVLESVSVGIEVQRQFGSGVYVLGSASGIDIKISHATVSRRHARLKVDRDRVTIEDLGSTNGTLVNGVKIKEPVVVQDQSVIVCGEVRLVLRIDDPSRGFHVPLDNVVAPSGSVLLGDATVGFMRAAGEEVAFNAGEIVVRRGEKQDVLYVVIAGEMDLLLKEGESMGRPLARLGEGAIFGAESVLGSEGAAVDAVAVSDVRLLRYPASALPAAMQESASLRRKLLGGIARNLHEATADALDLLKGTEVIARLVQGDHDPENLVAESARMRAVKTKIERCGLQMTTVLVTGDDGTGKTLAARLIHDASARASGALIAVNCRDLSPGHAGELIFGEDFGGRLSASSHGRGGIHLAHGGTLVLRDVDALESSVQELLENHITFERSKSKRSFPDTRIILTSRTASGSRDAQNTLMPALIEAIDDVIEMPPLIDRPKDILPLAEEFLNRHGPDAPVMTERARHALLSMRFQRRNVAELREVVDLAVRVADGSDILAEHIFSGVGEEAVPGIDITESPLVLSLLQRHGTSVLRAGALTGFLGVIVVCLAFASSWIGRMANVAIWSLWEPVVFALFLVAGPIWCTVCPLSTAARLAQRVFHKDRPPPSWMKRHGPWLTVVGFALIVWAERVFHSPHSPFASGCLLAALIAVAVVFGMVYRREVWCRHLCPLGALATALAPASPLQLSAKQRVCASSCTTHACYKGTADIPGCTVFHHPLEGKQAHHCKLCLDCLKSCPHGSARLQVRMPLAAVWRLDSGATDITLFAVAVTMLALAMVVTRPFSTLDRPIPFAIMCGVAITVGIAFHHRLIRSARSEEHVVRVVRIAVTGLMLGWSALMTVQLANIPILGDTRIIRGTYLWVPEWVPMEVSALQALQVAVVLFGCGLALFSLSMVRARSEESPGIFGWFPVWLGFLVYTALVLTSVIF